LLLGRTQFSEQPPQLLLHLQQSKKLSPLCSIVPPTTHAHCPGARQPTPIQNPQRSPS
jgi:hypothetical protein